MQFVTRIFQEVWYLVQDVMLSPWTAAIALVFVAMVLPMLPPYLCVFFAAILVFVLWPRYAHERNITVSQKTISNIEFTISIAAGRWAIVAALLGGILQALGLALGGAIFYLISACLAGVFIVFLVYSQVQRRVDEALTLLALMGLAMFSGWFVLFIFIVGGPSDADIWPVFGLGLVASVVYLLAWDN